MHEARRFAVVSAHDADAGHDAHLAGRLDRSHLDDVVARRERRERDVGRNPSLAARIVRPLSDRDWHRQGLTRAIQHPARPGLHGGRNRQLEMRPFGASETGIGGNDLPVGARRSTTIQQGLGREGYADAVSHRRRGAVCRGDPHEHLDRRLLRRRYLHRRQKRPFARLDGHSGPR